MTCEQQGNIGRSRIAELARFRKALPQTQSQTDICKMPTVSHAICLDASCSGLTSGGLMAASWVKRDADFLSRQLLMGD